MALSIIEHRKGEQCHGRRNEIRSLPSQTNPQRGDKDVRFEDLPEDIISMIFAKLELKETGRTSVLSSKWRRMWIVCPKLRFDGSRVSVWQIRVGEQQYTLKFIDNVNAVLKQQQGQVVESLEVKIEFHSMLVDHLNNWVRFAASSSTKNIALDLAPRQIRGCNDQYIFPFELLDGETISRLQHIQLSFVSFKLPSQFSGFPNLKKLDLHLPHVARNDLQDMLSGCSNLESLSIVRCNQNDELKVHRPLSRLLYLHVAHCEMTKIEINAMKLKTFVYKGVQLPVDPNQAQELEVADIVLDGEITFEYALTVLPKVLPSVQNLTLHAHLLLKSPWLLESSSKFSQVEHLKMLLIYSSEDMDNILSLASFLRAAPLIEGLEIHFNGPGYTDEEILPLTNLPKCSYKHLMDICITGFKGFKGQSEFLVHTLENAPALEVLTIDTTTKICVRSAQNVGSLGGSVARICLQGKILPKTKLHILSS